MPLTVAHYLRNMSKLTDQYFEKPNNYRDKDRQRIYLKDIDPPPVWTDKLREQLPPSLFYLNESTGDVGGPGAENEKMPGGGMRRGRGIGPAGDLMSSLPPSMRAENLMCYVGHEGTYTPAHREMCASLGHNIMVECSDVVSDEGKAEKPGSSIWFMTETKDRQTVSEYWLSILGHDIEVEKYFAQIAAWKKAPFTVYVCEQKAGDFLLIPPLAPHQVWNRGTRTMKVAWNRTTVETLDLALKEALPKAKMVCRDEQYKNKAIVYYSLQKYSNRLNKARDLQRTAPSPEEQNALRSSPKIRQIRKDFKRLLTMFKDILLSEMFAPDTNERNVQYVPFDGNITCAYCRGNIFNRFLTCPNCEMALGTNDAEPYDICMECYAMGRSCMCISKLRWVEQFKWRDLTARYEVWRQIHLYLEAENGRISGSSPLPLPEERQRYDKNTLAQICQQQLKRRPWVDISKPPSESERSDSDENEQIEYNEDGTIKKKKKRRKRTETWLKNNKACHVCCHRHPKWKMAECVCGRSWCYGTLFRGHDVMPQKVMEDPNWRCPHCQGICSAGNCRKDPRQKPYEPKGTLLGHDTRAVADARSVESLVDFSVSNLSWLKETTDTPMENARLMKKQEEAARDKAHDPALDGDYAHEDEEHHAVGNRDGIEFEDSVLEPGVNAPQHEDASFIDPSLLGDGHHQDENAALLPVAALLNRESEQQDGTEDEYAPATQSGYVAPAAVMYNAHQDSAHPDNLPSDSVDASGKKRKLTSEELAALKTRLQARTRPQGPVSGATKQYRKDYERRALEEARRRGRYIQVSAALKGKTKIVKLRISPAKLRHFKATVQDRTNELLASDVRAPDTQAGSKAPGGTASGNKGKEKHVRILGERDDDFSTRARDRKRKRAAGFGREVEEIDIPSDPNEDEDLFDEQPVEGALEVEGGRKRRRISQWQANRAAEGDAEGMELDEDGGVQLPTHGSMQHPNKSLPPRAAGGKWTKTGTKMRPSQPLTKSKVAGKSVPQIRPSFSGKSPKNMTQAVAGKKAEEARQEQEQSKQSSVSNDQNGVRDHTATNHDRDGGYISSGSSSSADQPLFQSSRNAMATAPASPQKTKRPGDENRLAKLEAAGMFEDDEFVLDDEGENDDSLFVKDVASASKPATQAGGSWSGLGRGIADIAKRALGSNGGGDDDGPVGSKSIFAKRGGPGGKKIKIVGSKKKT